MMISEIIDRVNGIDISVMNWFSLIRGPGLFGFFRIATYGGSIAVTLLMMVGMSAGLYHKNKIKHLIYLWGAYLGAEITTWGLKYLIDRPRPTIVNGVSEFNPSFPSGHATAVTSILLYMAYYCIKHSDLKFRKLFYLTVSLLLITFILFSRLYLNLHYLSDVFAGFLVGAIWAVIACLVCESDEKWSMGKNYVATNNKRR